MLLGYARVNLLIRFEGTPDYENEGPDALEKTISKRIRELIGSNLRRHSDVKDVGMTIHITDMEEWGTLDDFHKEIIKRFEQDAEKLTVGTINIKKE